MSELSGECATATLPLHLWLRLVGAAVNSDTIHPVTAENGEMNLGGDEELLEAINALVSQIFPREEDRISGGAK